MLVELAALVLTMSQVPAKAELRIASEHPYYFRDGATYVYLLGVSDRAAFFIWRNAKGFDWRDYLVTLHEYGFNYVRQDVTAWHSLDVPAAYPAQFSNPAWPFLRPGPGLATDGKPRFDLSRFNEEFFQSRLRPFLARAQELGIYVELTLFDGIRTRRAATSPYDDRNNINELSIEPRVHDTDQALANEKLRAIQEGYVTKVLAETREFGNVIYEICNESGGRQWVAHFVDFIHNHPQYPSSLVSAGEQASAFDPVSGANDIVIKHRGKAGLYATDADVKRHHDALLRFRAGKPIIHNEYFLYVHGSTSDPNFVRKMMWADFTAGGHSNFFDFRHWRGTGRTTDDGEPSHPPPREILEAGRHLRQFIQRVPFWRMEPADECVKPPGSETFAMALAVRGTCYVVYLLGEQVSEIKLALPDRGYRPRWYDPKTGRLRQAPAVQAAGGELTLQVPDFEDDIVLWLQRSP